MAKVKTYQPLDNDYYHVEEYLIDSHTGKKHKTGKIFVKTEKVNRSDIDKFNALSRKLTENNEIILFVPPEVASYTYKLV